MIKDHRDEVLSAIRSALQTRGHGHLSDSDQLTGGMTVRNHRNNKPDNEIRASASSVEDRPGTDPADLFSLELQQLGGRFFAARGEEEVKAYLAELMASKEIRSAALSDGLLLKQLHLQDWLSPRLERFFTVPAMNTPLRTVQIKSALADIQLGVTSCSLAIAETGTLLITADDETNRLMSLLPPIHVAILTRQHLVPTLAEALRRLQQDAPLSRAITLITGPSRTADIELTLTIGVHGPKEIHAVLLER